MLLRFEVSNHRSVLDPVELSMVAVDEDRPSVRAFDRLPERVLAVAGIYGANASGKSNVIEALAWLSAAVRRSLRAWERFIPRDPFKFGRGPQQPSVYEVEMVVAGVRYAYRLEVDDSAVLFEGLYSYPERRRRVLFEREGLDVRFRRGLGTLSGTKELLTPTTLVLSAAMRFNEPQVQEFAFSLGGIAVLGMQRRAPWRRRFGAEGFGVTPTELLFEDADSYRQHSLFEDPDLVYPSPRESALALLRFADLGIDDVKFVEEVVEEKMVMAEPDRGQRRGPRRKLTLVHRVRGQDLPFDLEEESIGTQTWFALIGPTLNALRSGRVLLFDEIDASLHPRLSARLVELFDDPDTNPEGAQLIFTTHDTSLLNHLNRDEVWLTEKNEHGATTLTGLAEYGGDKVRRSLNLERAYLQGRFGAVPDLDQFKLRRALGLVSSDA
ncbi:MAG: ATP-binding protein [Actinomycetota bacterium]|nr:ATP-binding protein [Actinomycetota bacterium]